MKAPKEARALWLRLPQSDREDIDVDTLRELGLGAQAASQVKARAAALQKRIPDEWNVHLLVGKIVTTVDELRRLGKPKLAKALLTSTLERFSTGELDGRGFVSASAYVMLARAVARQRAGPTRCPCSTAPSR